MSFKYKPRTEIAGLFYFIFLRNFHGTLCLAARKNIFPTVRAVKYTRLAEGPSGQAKGSLCPMRNHSPESTGAGTPAVLPGLAPGPDPARALSRPVQFPTAAITNCPTLSGLK